MEVHDWIQLGLLVLVNIGLIPVGCWIFRANGVIKELQLLIAEIKRRLNAGNGVTGGVPTTCVLHGQRLDQIQKDIENLKKYVAQLHCE